MYLLIHFDKKKEMKKDNCFLEFIVSTSIDSYEQLLYSRMDALKNFDILDDYRLLIFDYEEFGGEDLRDSIKYDNNSKGYEKIEKIIDNVLEIGLFRVYTRESSYFIEKPYPILKTLICKKLNEKNLQVILKI